MANQCFKRKVKKGTIKEFRICPLCKRNLQKGEVYYYYVLHSPNLRKDFRRYFQFCGVSHIGTSCENCYPKLPEELRKIIEKRDFDWVLDFEKGFWINKETGEREYFDE